MTGFLKAVPWWRHRLQCIVIVQSFLCLPKLHKRAVGKLDLSRGGLTLCHGVLDHGLNLHRNIPLKGSAIRSKEYFFFLLLLEVSKFGWLVGWLVWLVGWLSAGLVG